MQTKKQLFVFGICFLLIGIVLGASLQGQWFNQHAEVFAGPEDPLEAWSEYSYIIWQWNSTHYAARNMSTLTGLGTGLNTNKTRLEVLTMNNLTATGGVIFCKEITWNTTITLSNSVLVSESYQGQWRTYTNQGRWYLTQLASDPSTVGWGLQERGRWWFNTADNRIKYWDGTQIQALPGSGNLILSPSYTIYKIASTYYMQDEASNIDYSSSDANMTLTFAQNNLTSGGLIFLKAGNYSDLNLKLPTAAGNWIWRGEGQSRTHLISLANKPVFDTRSTSWDTTGRILTLEDLFIEGTGVKASASNILDLAFWNVFFNRIMVYGVSGTSATMLTIGGSGAPAAPSSIVDSSFVSTSGLQYSYMIDVWLESVDFRNPVFVLEGDDIRGLMVIRGTYAKISHPTIHSWSGRDITISAFTVQGLETTVDIDDVYYNHSGAVAPTYYLVSVNTATGNTAKSTRVTVHNVRVAWQNTTTYLTNSTTTAQWVTFTGYFNNRPFQNSGISTSIKNGDTITHGVINDTRQDGTKGLVAFLTIGSANTIIASITATNATTFTVGLKWANGTAVDANHSPQTIYWNAWFKP